jgi:Zn-dependent alcohol dehydrogenase
MLYQLTPPMRVAPSFSHNISAMVATGGTYPTGTNAQLYNYNQGDSMAVSPLSVIGINALTASITIRVDNITDTINTGDACLFNLGPDVVALLDAEL